MQWKIITNLRAKHCFVENYLTKTVMPRFLEVNSLIALVVSLSLKYFILISFLSIAKQFS